MVVEAQVAQYDVLMLHTTPLYAGTRPFIFHFESLPTLFMPFLFTGECRGVVLAQGFFELVRKLSSRLSCLPSSAI